MVPGLETHLLCFRWLVLCRPASQGAASLGRFGMNYLACVRVSSSCDLSALVVQCVSSSVCCKLLHVEASAAESLCVRSI